MSVTVTHHRDINETNQRLQIVAEGDLNAGGAYSCYRISGFNVETNAAHEGIVTDGTEDMRILFQNGAVDNVGVNGVTHEALIAVLISRIEGFQKGRFACQENEDVRVLLMKALKTLKARSAARTDRGVEGTHEV